MLRQFLQAIVRFVEGGLPDIDEFASAVSSDPNIRPDHDAPPIFGFPNETRFVGSLVSMIYGWTKVGEDQAETLEVKLLGHRGIFTATLTNNTLVELTLNGQRIPTHRLPDYREPIQRMIRRVRKLEE